MQLKGQRILVTGASGGLGRALAVVLGGRGASLVLLARDRAGLAMTAKMAEAQGAAGVRILRADVSKPKVQVAVAQALRSLGGLDGLVNNAGVHAFATVAEMPESLLTEALNVNLFGALRVTQAALPFLRHSRGWVANIGSTLSYRSISHGAAYSASKAALARFSESLRDEEAGRGLRVFQLNPGVVITGLRDHALSHGVPVPGQVGLPYPRAAEETAQELCRAIEGEEREMISAAWPVKLWAKILVPWFGGLVDKKMRKQD